MEVKRITSNDFLNVAKEHEYFIWHFFNGNPRLILRSYYDSSRITHTLKEIVDLMKFPYFESEVYKEIDFLMNLDDVFLKKMFNKNRPNPVIIGFKKTKPVANTYDTCYCMGGFIDVIGLTNPEFLLTVD